MRYEVEKTKKGNEHFINILNGEMFYYSGNYYLKVSDEQSFSLTNNELEGFNSTIIVSKCDYDLLIKD